MKKIIIIILSVIAIVVFGILIGLRIYKNNNKEYYDNKNETNSIITQENKEISTVEISNLDEEKTTPNTLIIYKTYYAKCKHYVQEYKDIDASLVNISENELREKCREWDIDKFSSEEIELSKEVDLFCNQHYKIKLENKVVVIYSVDENGIETEYEQTGITTEYLTDEDILKLTAGIYVYGKENLTSTIEDYE